jgi:hypothetical protein
MSMGGFTGGNKKAFKEVSDVNIVSQCGKSERFFDRVYKDVTNLEYGVSTVLART